MSLSSILLVEDDPDSVLLTERAYRKTGLPQSFQVARDGEEAIAYLAGQGPFGDRDRYPLPALVLLDLNLPKKSGMDVLAWIRDQAAFANLPVVILTTSSEPEDLKQAYDLGVNSFLVKPATSETIQDLLNTYVLPIEQDLRILLIDEDPQIRSQASNNLRQEFPGLQVEEIGDSASLTQAFDQGNFDLVITDYRLPWTDGISVLRAVKSRHPAIPVIMCAEDGSEEIAVEAMKAGLDDYVIKSPRHFSRLASAVRVVANQSKHRKAARAAEVRYRNLYESVPICLFRATLHGQVVDGNQTLKNLLGFDDITSTSAYNLRDLMVSPDDRARLKDALVRGETIERFEAQIYGKDRQVIWAELNARTVTDERGKPLCMEGSIEDITARKQAQAQLSESEAEMRALFAGMTDLIIVTDRDCRYLKIAPTNPRLLFKPADELLNRTIEEAFPGLNPEPFKKAVGHTLDTGEPSLLEYSLPMDGKLIRFAARLTPLTKDTALMIVRDMTDQWKAERALQESDRRFRETLENVGLLALGIDQGGNITFCNDALLKVIGGTREEVLGQNWFERYTPPDNPVKDMYRELVARGTTDQMFPHLEGDILTPTGERRLVKWSVSILPGENGGLAGAISIGEDVTEQKKSQAAINDANARLEATLSAIPDLMFEVDPQGIICSYHQPETLGLFLPPEAFLGKNVLEIMPEGAARVIQGALDEAAVKGAHRGGTYFLDMPTGLSWSELSVAIKGDIHTPDGRFVVTVRDITERKHVEEALQQSEHRYRSFVSHSSEGIWRFDAAYPISTTLSEDEQITKFLQLMYLAECNDTMAKIHDFGQATEIIGKRLGDLNDPADLENINYYRDFIRNGYRLTDREYYKVNRQGKLRCISCSLVGIFENGYLVSLWGMHRDITERRQHERELESIALISSALREANTREKMVPAILDKVATLMNASSAALVRHDPGTGDMVVEMARGELGQKLFPRLPKGEGISGYVVSTGQVYRSDDIRKDALYGQWDVSEDNRSVVCVPLLAYGVTIGTLWAGRKDAYSSNEVRLLTAIADIAANSLHRVALFEQTERGMQRLAALHEIDTAINSSMDLQITFRVLLEQVISQLHVDAADVFLLNPQQHVLTCAAARGFRTHVVERLRIRLGEGHAGKAALERTTLNVSDIPAIGNGFVRAIPLADEMFASYAVTPLIAKGQVKGVLEVYHRHPFIPDQEWLDYLETLGGQAAIAVDNFSLFSDLQRANSELIMAFDETIEGWSSFLDLRDRETEGHSRRVAQMSDRLARALNVPDADLIHIRWGSLLHDIGKMGIPDDILLKPAALTAVEWEEMRRHPVYAYERLHPIKYLRPALDIPYCHHEKWDGSGYPRGLKGEQIPLAARLFAIVDVWDALCSDRPYRAAWSKERVVEHIRSSAGTHFDPQVVQVFLELIASNDLETAPAPFPIEKRSPFS